jgi:hypothetical protein
MGGFTVQTITQQHGRRLASAVCGVETVKAAAHRATSTNTSARVFIFLIAFIDSHLLPWQ